MVMKMNRKMMKMVVIMVVIMAMVMGDQLSEERESDYGTGSDRISPCLWLQDKDGISGAVAFAQMAADLASRGLTVADRVRQLQEKYGAYVGRQSYFIAERPEQSQKVFDMMRSGGTYPEVTTVTIRSSLYMESVCLMALLSLLMLQYSVQSF